MSDRSNDPAPEHHDPRRADAPQAPTGRSSTSWWGAAKRAVAESKRDNITDWAAALTYYGVLSIFPALLVIVSLVGLAGTSVSQALLKNVGQLASGSAKQISTTAITELQRSHGSAGIIALISLAAAIWSASGYVRAFMRAANAIYDIEEGRPIYKTLPLRIAITVATLVLLSVCATAVIISGPLAQRAGNIIGAGSAAVTAWDIAKWPILVLIAGFLFALLYWAAPNAKQRFRWVTPGVILAVIIWLVASAGFAFYIANFGSYKTYGSLAAVIIFLVWL